jgi:hypothetical protein
LFQNSVPPSELFLRLEDATVSEAKTYLEYAEDCLRIAENMKGEDRQTLLKIAEAWRSRAQAVANSEKLDKPKNT